MANTDFADNASPVPGTDATPADETFTPPDGQYADHWKGKMTNSPNAPGFDPSKNTTYEDQFGEVSITDTNDNGRTPAPEKEAATTFINGPFARGYIAAKQAKYTDEEIGSYVAGQRAEARKAGYTDQEINTYLGLSNDQGAQIDAMLKQNAQETVAAHPPAPQQFDDNPAQAFWDGIMHSTSAIAGQTAVGAPPTTLPHEQTGLAQQIAQGLGMFLGGGFQSMAVGAELGAAGGTVIEPGGGTVVGGVIGAAAGLILDASARAAAALAITEGKAKDPGDYATKVVTSVWNGTKEAAPTIAGMAVSGPVGALAAKAGAGTAIQYGTKMGAALVAMTGAAAAIQGQVPTFQSWVDGAISLAAFEVLGAGARRVSTPKAAAAPPPPASHETIGNAMADLVDHYTVTGEHPQDVAPRVANDTSYDGLVARDEGQNGPIDDAAKADMKEAWDEQGLENYSPGTRARWFASAVDDGVEVANKLLWESGDNPDFFNDLRAEYLSPQVAEDPTQFGEGGVEAYLQRLDSRAPASPEKVAAAIKEAQTPTTERVKQMSEPLTKGYRGSLEDRLHGLTTNAKADDITMRKLIAALPPVLSKPPVGGGFKTLDAKFDAYRNDPNGVTLDPHEQALYDQHIRPLEDLFEKLKTKVEGFLNEGQDVEGGENPIPFLNQKGLSRLQRGTAGSAVANLADAINRLMATVRYKDVTDGIIASEEFQGHAVKAGEDVIPPKGYLKINAPQFNGWLVDPSIAHPINDFLTGGPRALDLPKLTKINKLAIGALFALPDGLLAHGRNLIETWLPARGFDNLSRNPQFGRALKEVMTQGPAYIEVLRNGGSLISSGIHNDSLITFIMKSMGQSIAKDPDRWGGVAKALHLQSAADLGSAYMTGMSKELYRFGDLLYMQRYLEYRDKGHTVDSAIKETEKYMPTYRMPSQIMGQRWISEALGTLNITAFGRYEVAKYRALANGIWSLVDPKASAGQRTEAVGRLFVSVMLMTAGQYMMNSFVQHITGNDKGEFLWGGPLGLVQKGANAILSPSQDNFNKLLRTAFTPAPGTWEILQQLSGHDFFTGKDVAANSASARQQAAERLGHGARGLNATGSYDMVTDFPSYVGRALGVSNPSAGADFFKATQGMTKVGRRWIPNAYLQGRGDQPWVQFLGGN